MKVIIAGSRDISRFRLISDAVKESGFKITEVISGAAREVDKTGEEWAVINKIPVRPFPAKWAIYGKVAGYIRNKEMALEADALILIWDGKSKGSASMLVEAKRADLQIFEVIFNK